MHRDLKPENILYANRDDNSPIKVADFGLARQLTGGEMMKTACGTPGYVAPEILKNQGYASGAVDVWSAGVVLYILLCGFPPFYEEELPALFDQILHARYDFPSPWWDKISEDAKDLVKQMLTVNPTVRITAAKVLDHPFVTKADQYKSDQYAIDTDRLKGYQAKRKLQKAAQKVMALNALKLGAASTAQ